METRIDSTQRNDVGVDNVESNDTQNTEFQPIRQDETRVYMDPNSVEALLFSNKWDKNDTQVIDEPFSDTNIAQYDEYATSDVPTNTEHFPNNQPQTEQYLLQDSSEHVVINQPSGSLSVLPRFDTDKVEKPRIWPQVLLSCALFWCLCTLFGLIAFIVAVSSKCVKSPSTARKLKDISFKISLVGTIIGFIMWLISAILISTT